MVQIPGLKTVHNYSEMLNKITFWTVINLIVALTVLRTHVASLDNFILFYTKDLIATTGDVFEYSGIKINLVTLSLALVLGFVIRAFKLHDKLSDLFRIRHTFDCNYILLPLAKAVGVNVDDKNCNKKIRENRKDLMYGVFYKYASSASPNNIVDNHLIWMALDQWSWYWVILEGVFIWSIVAIAIYFFGEDVNGAYVISGLVVVAIALMYLIYRECKRYTRREVREILADADCARDIRRVLREI